MISRPNLPYLKDLIAFAAELGADQITFKVIKAAGNARENHCVCPTPQELLGAFKQLIEAEREFEDAIVVNYGRGSELLANIAAQEMEVKSNLVSIYESTICDCGDVSLCIKPNGDVTPCAYIPFTVGNVRDTHLHNIWLNSEYLQMIRAKKQNLLSTMCDGCVSFERCHGGCMAHTLAYDDQLGISWAPDPNCWKLNH
jgi:radical SAM protein with 4Fe4S-binding SPASM domain